MSTDDPIAGSLDRRYRRCCQPRRHELTRQRWTTYPALAGRPIPDIRRDATTANAANNPVVADLLRAHQDGDTDATTVLLCAFIPYVCRDPAFTVGPDRIADRWAALGRLLAITDPSSGDQPDEHRSFLLVLVGRMRRHATRLRYSPDRRVAAALPIPEVADSHRALDGRHHTIPGAVENQALARLDLQLIADHLRAGTIKPKRWQRLVNSNLYDATDQSERCAANRLAARLGVLTGHVA
jgi:hypothetical protein